MVVHDNPYYYTMNHTGPLHSEFGNTINGLPIIGRGMDVRGGIYRTLKGRENLVVNPDQDPEIYGEYLDEVAKRATNKFGHISRPRIPFAVFETVLDKMPYSEQAVERIHKQVGSAEEQMIELGNFMREGGGQCRHQALTVAALMWILKDADFVPGLPSIERSKRWRLDSNEKAHNHAWVRYTHGSQFLILDPAQKFYGTLVDSIGTAKWNYCRPEEEEFRRSVAISKRLGQTTRKGFFSLVLGDIKDAIDSGEAT